MSCVTFTLIFYSTRLVKRCHRHKHGGDRSNCLPFMQYSNPRHFNMDNDHMHQKG